MPIIRRVSLLTDFEDVDDPLDWELGQHGIYIHFEDPTYAPVSQPRSLDSPASASSASTHSSTTDDTSTSSALKSRVSSLSSGRKREAAAATTLSATYLPDVATAQGWNKLETLDSAMRKAGYKSARAPL